MGILFCDKQHFITGHSQLDELMLDFQTAPSPNKIHLCWLSDVTIVCHD